MTTNKELAEAFRDDIATELGIDPDTLPMGLGAAVVAVLAGWDAGDWEEVARTTFEDLAAWGDIRFEDGDMAGSERAQGERDDALSRYNEYREECHLPAIDYDGSCYGEADPESLRHTRAGAVTAWAERLGMDVRQVVAAPADRTVVWLLVGDGS